MFESARKVRSVDIICYCKMTSVMALDGVTSFSCLKDVTITCKHMLRSPTIAGIPHCDGGKLEEAEGFKWVFIVYCVLESK